MMMMMTGCYLVACVLQLCGGGGVVPPKIVPFQFRSDLVLASRTRVTCEAAEGDLPLTFQWWHSSLADLSAAPNTLIRSLDSFSSTVSISAVTIQHGGEYTCSVQNSAGQVNYTASLRVNLPPSWMVAPSSSTCRLGHSVRLDCSAQGEPPPTIQWLRLSQEQETPISRWATYNDKLVFRHIYIQLYSSQFIIIAFHVQHIVCFNPSSRQSVVVHQTYLLNIKYFSPSLLPNGSLLISCSGREEEGRYQCRATNSLDQITQTVSLDVQGR